MATTLGQTQARPSWFFKDPVLKCCGDTERMHRVFNGKYQCWMMKSTGPNTVATCGCRENRKCN